MIESQIPLIAQIDGELIESATQFRISVLLEALNIAVPTLTQSA